MSNDFVADLGARALIHQVTAPELGPAMAAEPFTLYAGFDPTADTLHIGNLVGVLALARAQRMGHRPIAVVGGATGMIGDPSGKSEERNLLDEGTLARNLAGIRRDLERILDFSSAVKNPAMILNNADWIAPTRMLEFLRDIGKCFTINAMLAKESVKLRIESETGISFTEFTYMLLQAWDFHHLHREYGCKLQVGGSDQWGNITAGIDLIRRKCGADAKAYGLTWPLILDAAGKKFGKTEKGALWMSERRTSHFDFYQYFVRTADADVGRYLRIFTFLPLTEIAELELALKERPEKREAHKALAREVTGLVRGPAGVAVAERATAVLYENAKVEALDDATLAAIFADVPSVERPRAELEAGWPLIDALVASGLAKQSKSEARRLIEAGGVYVNNVRAEGGLERRLGVADLASETMILLRAGKKNHALLRFR